MAKLITLETSVKRLGRGANQPLFDTLTYAAAGAASYRFFNQSVGGAVTEADTNMTQAAQLPEGGLFILDGFALEFKQPEAAADFETRLLDFNKVRNAGLFRFKVGSTDIIKVPASQIPSWMAGATGAWAHASTAAASSRGFLHSGVAIPKNIFPVRVYEVTQDAAGKRRIQEVKFRLEGKVSFQVSLEFPAGLVTVSADWKIRCYAAGAYFEPLVA
jgi:hypothetical protein